MAGKQVALYYASDDKTPGWPRFRPNSGARDGPQGRGYNQAGNARNSDWLSIAEQHNNWRSKGASKKIYEHYLYFSTAVCAVTRRGGGGGGGPAGAFSRGDASHFTSHAAGRGGVGGAIELE